MPKHLPLLLGGGGPTPGGPDTKNLRYNILPLESLGMHKNHIKSALKDLLNLNNQIACNIVVFGRRRNDNIPKINKIQNNKR